MRCTFRLSSTRAIVNVPENTQPASIRATPWLYNGLTSVSRGVPSLIGTVVVATGATVDVEPPTRVVVVLTGSVDGFPEEHARPTTPNTMSNANSRAGRVTLVINDVYQPEHVRVTELSTSHVPPPSDTSLNQKLGRVL